MCAGRTKFIAAHTHGFFSISFLDCQKHEYVSCPPWTCFVCLASYVHGVSVACNRYVLTGAGGSVLSEAPEHVEYLSLDETNKLPLATLNSQFKYVNVTIAGKLLLDSGNPGHFTDFGL